MRMKTIGKAKRVRVEMPLGERCSAWDCSAFGFGRLVAPRLPIEIELRPGTHLDLRSGELRMTAGSSIAA
jgi:hypothetical protein